ncbi:hypothetical protein [Parvularcula sp. LCG005]|uniref:hypothetical protein n=1 Tax=Parvularcula sp. LCG005 TaxID=3078805 RepID=UPI002941F394|nr:hypothetical protein [Parvularcula sp. LCG005]WOI54659.1 hypothetical protein RUI03_06570 [Parvularcula sp. LCG005]
MNEQFTAYSASMDAIVKDRSTDAPDQQSLRERIDHEARLTVDKTLTEPLTSHFLGDEKFVSVLQARTIAPFLMQAFLVLAALGILAIGIFFAASTFAAGPVATIAALLPFAVAAGVFMARKPMASITESVTAHREGAATIVQQMLSDQLALAEQSRAAMSSSASADRQSMVRHLASTHLAEQTRSAYNSLAADSRPLLQGNLAAALRQRGYGSLFAGAVLVLGVAFGAVGFLSTAAASETVALLGQSVAVWPTLFALGLTGCLIAMAASFYNQWEAERDGMRGSIRAVFGSTMAADIDRQLSACDLTDAVYAGLPENSSGASKPDADHAPAQSLNPQMSIRRRGTDGHIALMPVAELDLVEGRITRGMWQP